jgi:hypothetical protein
MIWTIALSNSLQQKKKPSYENACLPECGALQSGRMLQKFRRNLCALIPGHVFCIEKASSKLIPQRWEKYLRVSQTTKHSVCKIYCWYTYECIHLVSLLEIFQNQRKRNILKTVCINYVNYLYVVFVPTDICNYRLLGHFLRLPTSICYAGYCPVQSAGEAQNEPLGHTTRTGSVRNWVWQWRGR